MLGLLFGPGTKDLPSARRLWLRKSKKKTSTRVWHFPQKQRNTLLKQLCLSLGG